MPQSSCMAEKSWPPEPYRGLEYYDAADEALFGGRDEDIENCIGVLTGPRMRILLLHGRSGVGKSSFLRAGLIPRLERSEFGFVFLRNALTRRPAFIRCTAQPMVRIAEEVFQYTQVIWEVRSAEGLRPVDLSPVRRGRDDLKAFVQLCENPDVLAEILEEISNLLAHTLIVIVDQAEEAVTLSRKEPAGLFQFLKRMSRAGGGVKLILSLRTENFGEFFRFLSFRASVFGDVGHVLLGKLTRESLTDVILLPTSKEPKSGLRAPFEEYKFEYVRNEPEGDVIETMLDDLYQLDPDGGFLPPMQIACRDMYNEIQKQEEPWRITRQTYLDGGNIKGRIDKHVKQSLRRVFQSEGVLGKQNPRELEQKWRYVLSEFTLPSLDGTVRTNVLSEKDVTDHLRKQGILDGSAAVLSALTKVDNLVLRCFSELNESGENVSMYSLAHDVLALALEQWKIETSANKRVLERRAQLERKRLIWTAVSMIIVLLSAAFGYLFYEQQLADRQTAQSRMQELDMLQALVSQTTEFQKPTVQDSVVALTGSLHFLKDTVERYQSPMPGGVWSEKEQSERIRPLEHLLTQLPARTVQFSSYSHLPWQFVGSFNSGQQMVFWIKDGKDTAAKDGGLYIANWSGVLQKVTLAGIPPNWVPQRLSEVEPGGTLLLRFAASPLALQNGLHYADQKLVVLDRVGEHWNSTAISDREYFRNQAGPIAPPAKCSQKPLLDRLEQFGKFILFETAYSGCWIRVQLFSYNSTNKKFEKGPFITDDLIEAGAHTKNKPLGFGAETYPFPPGVLVIDPDFEDGFRALRAYSLSGQAAPVLWSGAPDTRLGKEISACAGPDADCAFGIQAYSASTASSYSWVRIVPKNPDAFSSRVPVRFVIIENRTGKSFEIDSSWIQKQLPETETSTVEEFMRRLDLGLERAKYFAGTFDNPIIGFASGGLQSTRILIAHFDRTKGKIVDIHILYPSGPLKSGALGFTGNVENLYLVDSQASTAYAWSIFPHGNKARSEAKKIDVRLKEALDGACNVFLPTWEKSSDKMNKLLGMKGDPFRFSEKCSQKKLAKVTSK